jgi:hypothetical protein
MCLNGFQRLWEGKSLCEFKLHRLFQTNEKTILQKIPVRKQNVLKPFKEVVYRNIFTRKQNSSLKYQGCKRDVASQDRDSPITRRDRDVPKTRLETVARLHLSAIGPRRDLDVWPCHETRRFETRLETKTTSLSKFHNRLARNLQVLTRIAKCEWWTKTIRTNTVSIFPVTSSSRPE